MLCVVGWGGNTVLPARRSRVAYTDFVLILISFLDYMEHIYSKACYAEMAELPKPSFDDWIRIVEKCGYATDPEYAHKLIDIMSRKS